MDSANQKLDGCLNKMWLEFKNMLLIKAMHSKTTKVLYTRVIGQKATQDNFIFAFRELEHIERKLARKVGYN